ncbi:putative ATP-dependent RNA helicase Dbp73D [Calliopsis andreniformis]|uniref:putative ATP-dependent RNA helicase Dbp73D n=1 Tax=Calliopsis andreniformis TaxID=337506 RepID=UPI003FCE246B
MSLFVINRYEGEKETETKHEKKHLSELLKRIEERKRAKAVKNESSVSQESNFQEEKETEPKKKKKKKDKVSESSVQDIFVNENVENNVVPQFEIQDAEQQKLYKTKRKKKKGIQVEEINGEHKITDNKNRTPQANDNVDDERNEMSNELIDSKNIQEQVPEQHSNFIVLGSRAKGKKREVKRVLPEWLANPQIISIDLNSGPSLEEFNSSLDSNLIEVLKANGINKLFPVQASMISWLLKCNKDRQQGWWLRDTCVSAPTGSGKTLAYVLPIVQILQSRLVPKIRCLIVVPVQELAVQVYKVMVMYTSHTNLKVGLLSGASPFQQEQTTILKQNSRGKYVPVVDIIVATSGRLIDHILKTPGFSLDDLRFLVIDEADRVANWLEYLPEPHHHAPRLTLHNMRCSKVPAQKLLFSATLSQDPEKLNRLGLLQPILFTSVPVSGKDEDVNLDKEVDSFVGRYTSPEELTELAVECEAEYKPLALYQLLLRNDTICKTLIFTNSGKTAHRLTLLLELFLSEKNISVGELSAQLMPKQREEMLKKFMTGEIQILVSSDALARGVDVPDVQLVVSYDLSKSIKGYIHRSGRTGRAGKPGTAISMLIPKQVGMFKQMLSSAHKMVPDIEKLELDSIANTINYSNYVEKLKNILEEEKQTSIQRLKAVKRIQSVIAE